METKIKKRSGPKPLPAANLTWTPDLAYACGLIASDGCLVSNGKTINLTSKDIEQLETFKRIFGLKTPLSWKWRGEHDIKYPQIQVCNVRLYHWFQSIGITPRKSLTIKKVDIPDEFFFDFLRGEFDGDGTSHAYWDTRWRSSVCIYISFASGSTEYLNWLQKMTIRLAGISGVIAKTSKAFSLKFAKSESKILFSRMYHDENIPYLRRKRDKLQRQFEADLLSKSGQFPIIDDRKHIIKIA